MYVSMDHTATIRGVCHLEVHPPLQPRQDRCGTHCNRLTLTTGRVRSVLLVLPGPADPLTHKDSTLCSPSWLRSVSVDSYVGNACPWCHRVTLTHTLLGLSQAQVSYSSVLDDPEKASRGGWTFDEGPHRDPVFGCKDLR